MTQAGDQKLPSYKTPPKYVSCGWSALHMYKSRKCHGGARQARDPWTAVLSLLALISRRLVINIVGSYYVGHLMYVRTYFRGACAHTCMYGICDQSEGKAWCDHRYMECIV